MQPENVQEAHDLLYMGMQDLQATERLLTSERPLVAPALFHSQQAAEKALQAYLAYHNRVYRRTHDLFELLGLCTSVVADFVRLRDAVNELTPYAVGGCRVKISMKARMLFSLLGRFMPLCSVICHQS
jgi:HEPN domain-containing protein